MEQNRPGRDLGADNPNVAQGDYEYDEAHDVSAEQLGAHPAPHRHVSAPQINHTADGDYGYDEAHDFGVP